MKKSASLSDDAFSSFDDGDGAGTISPAAAGNTLFVDDDADSYPLALAAATTGGSTNAGTAKPVATIATLADYLINGFWQYNSSIAHHWASNTITYNINGLNAAEQFLAQSALQAWHGVANVTFVETTGAANITFSDAGSMQAVTNASWYSNGAMASANVDISSDWISNDGGAMDGKTGIDSYGYQTYIHEIGHALGLGHQGPYNGSAVYSSNSLYADDTWQYSIMSYFAENNYSGSTYRYVVTPQMADIYAVGQIYGAATSTRTGDTVYGFHSNAGAPFDFSAYSQAPALTIYDSGGNDTLDCSGYSVSQTIDLHPGAFSSVGGLVHNIGIALSAVIENAIGGSGNDTLIASDTGCTLSGGAGNDTLIGGLGNDRLIGGSGVDTMTGGGGNDMFVFTGDSSAASGQHDKITDFVSGADHIDLSAIDAIAGTAAIDLFHFIGAGAFGGTAGELDYFYNSTLGVTTLQGDTNGDRMADFAIDFTGNMLIALGDLIGAYANAILLTSTTAQAVQGGATVGLLNGTPTIVDATSTTLSSVTIKVSAADGNVFPGDELYINGAQSGTVDGGRVTVSWSESAKILRLSGTASIADYQTLLSQISYQWTGTDFSTGAHTPHTVTWTLNDAMGSFGTTSLITIERPPAAAVANLVLNPNATTVAASSLLTVSDPDGDAIASYAFKDTGNGHFYLNGVAQSNNQEIDVTAAQLSLLTYQSAGGADSVQTRVSDGTLWSSWQSFTITGPAATAIEAAGSTSLVQVGNNYYLDGFSSGVGPELKFNGAAVTVGQFDPFVPVGVEQTSGGYEVALKNANTGQFSIWNTDSSGNFISFSVYAGTSTALETLETSFHQDLNGDGVIGIAAMVVESFGSTKLDLVGNNFYLDPVSGGSGPTLKYNSAAVTVGQFDPFVPVGVEQTSGGYEVALKNASTGQFSIWNTDNNGNFLSFSVYAGTSSSLESVETSFHQDLNGDGVIGVAATVVESFGSTKLDIVGSIYLDPVSGGSGPTLKYNGAAVTVGQFDPFVPVGVEQTSGGYEVALKNANTGQFSIWNTDSSGNFISFSVYAGTSTALETLETSFHQDLNGDGVIGIAAMVVESFGSTKLDLVGNNFYLDPVSGGSGPTLKYNSAAVTVGQFDPFVPVGVEQTSGGYEVALKNASTGQFSIWNTDNNGNFLSFSVYAGTSSSLESVETSFHQDLNGDGTVGLPVAHTQLSPARDQLGAVPNVALDPIPNMSGSGDAFTFRPDLGAGVNANVHPPGTMELNWFSSFMHDLPTSPASEVHVSQSQLASSSAHAGPDPLPNLVNYDNVASINNHLADLYGHDFIIQ